MFQTSEKSPLFNRSYYSLFRIQKEEKNSFLAQIYPKEKYLKKNMDEKTSSSVVLKFGTIKLKSQYPFCYFTTTVKRLREEKKLSAH